MVDIVDVNRMKATFSIALKSLEECPLLDSDRWCFFFLSVHVDIDAQVVSIGRKCKIYEDLDREPSGAVISSQFKRGYKSIQESLYM